MVRTIAGFVTSASPVSGLAAPNRGASRREQHRRYSSCPSSRPVPGGAGAEPAGCDRRLAASPAGYTTIEEASNAWKEGSQDRGDCRSSVPAVEPARPRCAARGSVGPGCPGADGARDRPAASGSATAGRTEAASSGDRPDSCHAALRTGTRACGVYVRRQDRAAEGAAGSQGAGAGGAEDPNVPSRERSGDARRRGVRRRRPDDGPGVRMAGCGPRSRQGAVLPTRLRRQLPRARGKVTGQARLRRRGDLARGSRDRDLRPQGSPGTTSSTAAGSTSPIWTTSRCSRRPLSTRRVTSCSGERRSGSFRFADPNSTGRTWTDRTAAER